MAYVAPSEAIRVIDDMFSGQKENMFDSVALGAPSERSKLNTIAQVVESIPSNLLTLDGLEYAAYVAGISALKSDLADQRTHSLTRLPAFDNKTGLWLIYQALHKCRDTAPSPETVGLEFIDDDELRDNLRLDISSAYKALSDDEWKAATVLAGSVVEALLLWDLERAPREAISNAAKELIAEKRVIGTDQALDRWNLYPLIQVAERLHKIVPNTANACLLAKDYRNLIHPGRAQRLKETCNRATALSALAAVEHVVVDIQQRGR